MKKLLVTVLLAVFGALAFAAEEAAASGGLDRGLIAVGMGLAVGLAALGTGVAQARIGAAGVGSVISLAVQLATGAAMAELPGLMLSNSLHGLASALLMWVAFVPPAAWRRFVLESHRATAG